ncbi:unnamed protein product [Polarella glacialis]|uniref:Glutamine synthetase type III N-terminal domain-containing protein n=1 Tax=Polarella glacialis TaxID=89957 RepID=A0A813JCW2_POLGL|nr:unnamed protein product [Polarella glacialis]
MYENYNTTLAIEAKTMIHMMETGILPACAKDLQKYTNCKALVGDREQVYGSIMAGTQKLKEVLSKVPHSIQEEATYYCDVVKPQMVALREVVDTTEGLLESGLYPYPTYEPLVREHCLPDGSCVPLLGGVRVGAPGRHNSCENATGLAVQILSAPGASYLCAPLTMGNCQSEPVQVVVEDCLDRSSTAVWDDATAAKWLPKDVHQRFKECLMTGEPTRESDRAVIAEAMFKWARGLGATDFAHWFFPMRGGGGAVGGCVGAFKMDTMIDLEWSSPEANKPFKATLPADRLFQGETDGSSFPNGGLRVTHSAAAFTTWDRSSPPMIVDKVLRIPCSFVTHTGKCIDDKTPLLRSSDAVHREGLRLLTAMGMAKGAKAIHSFLGWEQEFFVVHAAHFKARPDLVNCGRTLIGALPTRNQQMDLNYFGPVPDRVERLMVILKEEMLKMGSPWRCATMRWPWLSTRCVPSTPCATRQLTATRSSWRSPTGRRAGSGCRCSSTRSPSQASMAAASTPTGPWARTQA